MRARKKLKARFALEGGTEEGFERWWRTWGNSIISLIEHEGLDISVEEGVTLVSRVLSTFQQLDKRAQGLLARILVIVYDYVSYKYEPAAGLTTADVIGLLADRAKTSETGVIEALQTLKTLRVVSPDVFPNLSSDDDQYRPE
jgi:hypothetical protein